MLSFHKFALLLSLAISVSALTTPNARSPHIHHARAARAVQPLAGVSVNKRASRRCAISQPGSAPSRTPTPSPSSSVVPAAPTPTSSTDQAPPPPTSTFTPDPAPTTTSDSAPAPAPTPSQAPAPSTGGGAGQTGSGAITFYATGLGACGITNNDGDFIAAASHEMFDSWPGSNGNPNQNPICGQRVAITLNGKTTTVTLTDRCEGCVWGDFDLSPTAFNTLADPSVGRTTATWVMV